MNWENRIYESLIEPIDEISLKYAATVAGKVQGKAAHRAATEKASRQRGEIKQHPRGTFDTEQQATSRGTKTDSERKAEDYRDAKGAQAHRIKTRLQARAAAAGKGAGEEGKGIKGREGKKAKRAFEKIQHREHHKAQGKAGGVGPLGRLVSKVAGRAPLSRGQRKAGKAHKEHFKTDPGKHPITGLLRNPK